MDYVTKINDFKEICNDIINPESNDEKRNIIEALFDNVKKNYEEYKDTIPLVSVYYEPYQYHILQPINGFYPLLDFLLNRAISNLERINLTQFGGNSYSNHFEINIDLNRYKKMASKKTNSIIQQHYKKSKYHETLHILHSKFDNEQSGFFSHNEDFFRKKVRYFYEKLGRKYPNIINPSKLTDVSCNRYGTERTKPFQKENWGSISLALDEFSTEMEAILNSGLINSEGDLFNLDGNYWQILPNFDNGYAPFQIFLLQFKTLVNKLQYFGSVFFHTSTTIDEFIRLYSNQILLNAGNYQVNNNAMDTFCNLFKEAIVAVQTGNNRYNIYETLSRIFIEIYKNKLNNVEQLEDNELISYKKALAISYNQAPRKYINGKLENTWISESYYHLYKTICDELERRNNKKIVNN